MSDRYAVVLAAGKGTRMKSKLYKVLHPVLGKPMVQHVVDQLQKLELSSITTIVGFGAEKVQDQLGDASNFAIQEEQLGTGHAVLQADKFLKDKEGTTIVVCGDTPLLTDVTLKNLIEFHEKENAKVSVLTTKLSDPTGYGRVVRNDQNQVEKIVEQKDASVEEQQLQEVNTGTYCFDNQFLFDALSKVSNNNSQGEYYLPDVIEIAKKASEKVSAYQTIDDKETIGVNDRVALSQAEMIMKKRVNEKHMRNGVSIVDPEQTYIEADVEIESDVVIYPGCVLRGKTHIKTDATIGPNTEIIDCHVGEATTIRHSMATTSYIGDRVQIGPFAHIRPEAEIGSDVKIGNFVEIKKSKIADTSKVPHLSYIGDAEVGRGVNIGCGTITVNYDGKNKFLTTIEDDVFIGCNSNLVAPVTVKKGAYVAAGSTINRDVPEEALSIGRARQVNKEEYAKKFK